MNVKVKILFVLTLFWPFSTSQSAEKVIPKCNSSAGNIHRFYVEDLEGTNVSMSSYKNQVLLLVNVATFCGFTKQYLELNALLANYTNRHFRIAGFPCNQFLLQEPGKNSEILNGLKYVRPGNGFKPHLNFKIYGKLEVNGKNAHPMYKFLKEACPPTTTEIGKKENLFWDEIRANDITWNFEKFVIDKNGRPLYRLHPSTWNNGAVVRPLLEEAMQISNTI